MGERGIVDRVREIVHGSPDPWSCDGTCPTCRATVAATSAARAQDAERIALLRATVREMLEWIEPLRLKDHGPRNPDECERGLCGHVKRWRARAADEPQAQPSERESEQA